MSTRRLIVCSSVFVAAALAYVWVRRGGEGSETPAPEPLDPAVEALVAKRGRVTRDESVPGRPVLTVRFSGGTVSDDDLKLLAPFPDLTAVHLPGTSITDDGLKRLRPLGRLRTLDLRRTRVTDAGLTELRHFAELEELVLRETRVTNAGMPALSALGRLRSLDLAGTDVTGDGLRHLEGLRRLRTLELPPACGSAAGVRSLLVLGLLHQYPGALDRYGKRAGSAGEVRHIVVGVPVSAEVLPHLTAFPNLTYLGFHGTLTDEALGWLQREGLIHLTVNRPPTPDGPGYPEPAGLVTNDQDITLLSLSESLVSDAGLIHLAGLHRLKILDLSQTRITARGLAALINHRELETIFLPEIAITVPDLVPFHGRERLTFFGGKVDWSDALLKEARENAVLHLLPRPGGTSIGSLLRSGSRELDLSGSSVTDTGVRELAGLTALTELNLSRTAVTDVGLKDLERLTNLQVLNLARTRVTPTGVAAFKAAVPKCLVAAPVNPRETD